MTATAYVFIERNIYGANPMVLVECAITGEQRRCCLPRGFSSGPSPQHVRSALAGLTKACTCGASFHRASGGEDQGAPILRAKTWP